MAADLVKQSFESWVHETCCESQTK